MGFFDVKGPEDKWKERFYKELKSWGVDEKDVIYRKTVIGHVVAIPFVTKKGRKYFIRLVIGTDNTNYVYVGKKIDHTLENLERINDLNVKYLNLTFALIDDGLIMRSIVIDDLETTSVVSFMRDMARIAAQEFPAFPDKIKSK